MNTLINLLKIYLGFFVENTVFSSIIYGLIFKIPQAIYFGITSYLNVLLWVYLKNVLKFDFLGLTNLRPCTNLVIDCKIAKVIYKFSQYGMPSLHSIYTGYTLSFWYFHGNREINYPLFGLYSLVVSSRLYFNVHTLGQVIVGSILGFICGWISFYFYTFLKNKIKY